MERLIKLFRTITLISRVITIAIAAISVVGIVITGFYPGIIVLILVTLIPVLSGFYSKRIIGKSIAFQRNYFIAFSIINLLLILIVTFMSFVILVDRVFPVIL
jgi:hypothetical protein